MPEFRWAHFMAEKNSLRNGKFYIYKVKVLPDNFTEQNRRYLIILPDSEDPYP